jgi:REP element-mobilizing transposase RayT
MTRPLRVEYPGAFYHVINRGNAGEDLFPANRDRVKFLEYLERTAETYSVIIHTYCLMTNHYHLLLETPQANLSTALQWMNVSYATYFNKKYNRSGHLFQGRFKALLINADEYLSTVSRYIHRNPVQAGIATKPAHYLWSSYRAFIRQSHSPGWLETGRLLQYFGKRQKEAIKQYRAFVEQADPQKIENPQSLAVGGFILGGTEFITWIQDRFLFNRSEQREVPQLKKLRPRPSLSHILKAVSKEFSCREKELQEKGRKRNKGREAAIYLSRSLTGISCKELGEFFGGISGAAITMKYKQCSGEIITNKKLRQKINRINRKILNI